MSETSEYSESSQSNVLITISEYESEEEHDKIESSKKKRDRKQKVTHHKIYVLAYEALASETRQTTKPPGRKGQKTYYRCNLVMFRDPCSVNYLNKKRSPKKKSKLDL